MIKESEDYVRKNFEQLRAQLSKEHQGIAKEFLEFKKKTFDKMDIMDGYHEKMKWAELALALNQPIYEAEY